MIPSIVASELQEAIRRFLYASFPMTTPGFRREDGGTMLDDLLAEPEAIFKGPYLGLGLPFRRMESGAKLPFERIELSFTPYRHQFRAFQRLCGPNPRSTLVATGTGSGKTECFSLPILDYCAGRPEQGVKAIIVYPMNALAADQARRFARDIHDRESLRGRVSVGLYVGDSGPSVKKVMSRDSVITCRETLREYPPDILLTNYKMLDFLLLRPRDQRLWRHNEPNRLRYLVVDELHTFDGAQGTDLACLVRRLRDRLLPGEGLACVGTSATLGGEVAGEELIEYASQVFASPFDADAVVMEDRETAEEFLAGAKVRFTNWPTTGAYGGGYAGAQGAAVDDLRKQAMRWFGGDAPALDARDPAVAMQARFQLAERLRECGAFRELLERTPGLLDINAVVAEWAQRFRIEPAQARQMLDSLLALVSWARSPKEPHAASTADSGQPFVNLRMQLWLRELSRLVATVGSRPMLRFADDLTDLASPLHLPVVHCRECHATGWLSVRKADEGRLETELQSIYRTYFGNHPEMCLLFPLEGTPPAEPKGIEGAICPQCGQLLPKAGATQCPHCQGDAPLVAVWEPNMRRTQTRGDLNLQRSHHDCPFCGAHEGLSLIGSRAASLASVLIGRLFASPYNDHRKLIAFSDAVQDAAHRAGFFGARTYSTLIRGAIARFVTAQGEGLPLSVVASEMPRYWRNRTGSEARFVGTFIAPNMEWLRDYEHLKTQGQLPPHSAVPGWVEQRLTWEVLQAFGLRARIGRTLERSRVAAVGPDPVALRESAARLARWLSEEIGSLRGIGETDVLRYLLGFLWRMRVGGAFYHPMLDSYIQDRGKPYALYRTPHMPNYGGAAAPPALVTLGRVGRSFTALAADGRSGYADWFDKTLAVGDAVLASAEYNQVIQRVLGQLTQDGFLIERDVGGDSVWGLDPGRWICTTAVAGLTCERCGHQIQVPRQELGGWTETPCLRSPCAGTYQPSTAALPPSDGTNGALHRLVAAEHTALLDGETRHAVEHSFIYGDAPWDVNLLSATPTLEMGIDIGDLSAVLLCSVPPGQANYLQRIGRAGRRDGNALTVTLANAHKHDLYFYADPLAMLAGEVRPPGVFLQATAVLERQLIAYCFDRWAASGIDDSAIPGTLQETLNGVESESGGRFPLSLLEFVERHRAEILRSFLGFFPDLPEESRVHLGTFLFGGGATSGMAVRLVNRLHQLVQERKSLAARIDRLKKQKERLESQPQDDRIQEELEAVLAERGALMALRRRMNGKPTLNFFTDEGLLPNYAFPEEGVTIHSVILRRVSQAERDDGETGRRYERINFEMQRPAVAALSELAPLNRFYAVGRRVEIDQVDLSVSTAQEWRLCDRCHYMENVTESGDAHKVCPRCGSPQWADAGRKRTLLKLRQVFATADDRGSRIGDDSDQRTPAFFQRQMLVDVPLSSVGKAYRLASEELPFGFEYLPRVKLREVNFGQPGVESHEFAVAGELASRPGFQLCRHCGKVRRKGGRERASFQHAYDCKLRKPGAEESEADYFDSLYLFRELESEAVRILLPLAEVGSSGTRLHSLIAALNLGLRRYFRGDVGHIQVAHQSEPAGGESRKHFLVLFDSVPGGTGYLKELLRQPENLITLLRSAFDVVSRCECREDETRDGCYRCLLAYRESRRMDEISRKAAEEILGKILAAADTLQPIDGLASVDINALLESELEQRFVDALANAPGVTLSPQLVHGKSGFFMSVASQGTGQRAAAWKMEPQVQLGPGQGVAVQTKPDFVLWPVREAPGLLPVAIFMDGFQYHWNKVDDDTLKRQALLDSGRFRVWTLSWHTLPMPGMKQVNPAAHLLKTGQQATMQTLFTRLAPSGGWDPYLAYGGFIDQGPFRWLQAYLSGDAENLDRLRFAALSRALGWLDSRSVQDPAFRNALLEDVQSRFPEAVHADWSGTQQDPRILGGLLPATGGHAQMAGIDVGVCLPRSAMQAAAEGDLQGLQADIRLHLAMDDEHARQDKDFEMRWGAFWGAANLLQFLPRLTLASARGIQQGLYGAVFQAAEPSWAEPQADEGDSLQWQEIAQNSLFGERVFRLRDAGVPPPEVGIELVDEAGVVLPEIELLWREERIAVVADVDESGRVGLERLGWTVLEGLDDRVITELTGRLTP
jgi:DEAD/DEAH box helicase domain-containing protein